MSISVFLTYINQKVAFFDKIKTKRQSIAHQQCDAISSVSPPASLPFQCKEPFYLILIAFVSVCWLLILYYHKWLKNYPSRPIAGLNL